MFLFDIHIHQAPHVQVYQQDDLQILIRSYPSSHTHMRFPITKLNNLHDQINNLIQVFYLYEKLSLSRHP